MLDSTRICRARGSRHCPPVRCEDRRADLARFEALLDECERLRVAQLPFDELRELGRLYRRHAAELARIRERDEDPEAIRHLNALCVRAYTHLYPSPPPEQARAAGFSERLSLAIARTWRPQLLAWTLLLTGLILGAALESPRPRGHLRTGSPLPRILDGPA